MNLKKEQSNSQNGSSIGTTIVVGCAWPAASVVLGVCLPMQPHYHVHLNIKLKFFLLTKGFS